MSESRPSASEQSVELVVLGELARGGMARVELARVLPDGEILALKRLLPLLAMDTDFVHMFMDEAWMGAALNHENIVRVLACGEDEEGMFLAMELVRGAPLSAIADAARQSGEAFPEALVAVVALGVSRGLAAAHSLRDSEGVPFGLVHRDVTPSNVLCGFDGAVKLTDFGVARAAGRASQTADGMLKGKLSFLAPEYARSRQLDGRSDLYALGVTLFWLATGKRPFEGPSDAELLRRITDEPAPPLQGIVPGFDPDLARLIMRLLHKDPGERPPDASAVCRELERWLERRGMDPDAQRRALGEFVARHGAERRQHIDELISSAAAAQAASHAVPTADTTAALGLGADGASGVGADPDAPTLSLERGRESRRARLTRSVPALELRRTQRHRTRVVAAPALGLPSPLALDATPSDAVGRGAPGAEAARRGMLATVLAMGTMIVLAAAAVVWWPSGRREEGSVPTASAGLRITAGRLRALALRSDAAPSASEDAPSASGWSSTVAPDAGRTASPATSTAASSSRPRPTAAPPPRPPPTTRTTSTPPRACTPSDFDYPNCQPRR